MTILPHEKQIFEYEETIRQVIEQNKNNSLWSEDEIKKLEKKLLLLKEKIYSNLSSWDRVLICRHPKRPHSIDYLQNICDEYEEIFGDRRFTIVGDMLKKVIGKNPFDPEHQWEALKKVGVERFMTRCPNLRAQNVK